MRLFIIGFLVISVLVFCRCDKQCNNISLQNDFDSIGYIKFPIFNKIMTKDTSMVNFRENNGLIHSFIYNKGKMLKGFNSSKALKANKGSILGNTSDCERESFVKQSAYLSKKIDSTAYLEIEIYKCQTIDNAPDPCPDSIRFFSSNRFIGDTVINGKNYSNVRALTGNGYRSYSLVNLSEGVIYFELTTSGKKFWQVQ